MDKNHIDKIFQDGLKSDMSFDDADRQWEKVHDKLHNKRRRSAILFLSLHLLAIMTVLAAIGIDKTDHVDREVSKIEFNAASVEESIMENRVEDNLSDDALIKHNNLSSKYSSDDLIETEADISIPNIKEVLRSDAIRKEMKESKEDSYSRARGQEYVRISQKEMFDNLNSQFKIIDPVIGIAKLSPLPSSTTTLLKQHAAASEDNLTEIFEEKPNPNFVYFSIGTQKEWLGLDEMIDSTSWSIGLNLKFNLRKRWSFIVGYNEHQVHRSFRNNYGYYNYSRLFPETYAVEYALLENSHHYLKVKSQNIDFGLSYPIFSKEAFQVEVFGGVQFNNFSSTEVRLVSIYTTEDTFIELPGHGFKMTDVFTGAELSLPIYRSFGLLLSYKYYHSTDESFYKWGNRHRFFSGLNFKF